MALEFDVPDYKKIRVIVDTDAACEADDPFAIVHALLSPKLIVKGVVADTNMQRHHLCWRILPPERRRMPKKSEFTRM